MFLLGRIFFVMTILAVFTPPLHAQLTWSGGGGDDNWSTGDNWAGTPPVTGDALIFAGSTRLVNTNDIALLTNSWGRFDAGGFKLWGNALTFTNGLTNAVGINQIGADLYWTTPARNIHVATGSELVIAGTETVSTGDLTNTGGGRIRLTGKHFQAPNPPATILNNIEYVIDGGTFSNAGGVRITSGITPTASKLILTNGAIMIQGVSGGAIRVGDNTGGALGTLIIDHSTLTHVGGNIFIPFAASGLGVVTQNGGTNSGANIAFCNGASGNGTYNMIGGTLETVQIRKVNTTTTSATITFDGSTVRPVTGAVTAFFTGIDTAEIKAGGLIFDNNGFNVTVAQVFTGAGGFTKVGSGTLTWGAIATAHAGGFNLNEGVLALAQNNSFGTGTLTINGGTIQSSSTANRNFTNNITIGGNYTADGSGNVTANGNVTLPGDRTINVNIPAALGAHVLNGVVGESGGTRSITKVGSGILQLNGVNTYSGNTVVSNGAVQVNSTSRLGNEAGTLVLAGGALFTSANRTVGTSPIGNPISLIADSEIATVSTAAEANLNLTGVPTTTAGTLTIRNLAPSGTGAFEPRFAAGGFTFTSPINIINNTNGTSFARLNFFNTNGTDQTFSGVISGNGGVRRSVSSGTGGRTILTAANTYSGLTTINDGTLVVNNTSGSGTGTGDIVLGPSGVLAGTGTVAGAVSGTGSVSAGESVGTFTIGNGLNLSTGGTEIWELSANTTSGAGTSFDRLVLTGGNLVLGGTSRVSVKFIGTATFPDSTNAFWQQTNTWKIIDLTGPAANPGLTIFSGVDGAAGNNAGSFSTSADGTGIYLTFTPGVLPPPPLIDPNIVGAGTTNAQLNWSSVAGASYTVQYKTNITQVDWLNLTNLTATGMTTTIVDNTSPVPVERYYRVISP